MSNVGQPPVVNGHEIHSHVGEWCPLCVRYGEMFRVRADDPIETDLEACSGALQEALRQLHIIRSALRTPGQWSYDDEYHWLVFTESEGASAIIAYDVQPQWAARILRDVGSREGSRNP